jgi:hypothetical protein
VTRIGKDAFRDCRSLTSVVFEGTSEQWLKVNKGALWDFNTGDYTVYCTDGTVAKDGTVTKN